MPREPQPGDKPGAAFCGTCGLRVPKKRKRAPLPPSSSSPFLTVGETAELLRVSKKAVYRLYKAERLPMARRFEGRLLWRRSDLLTLVEKSKEKAKAKGRVPAASTETQA